MAQWEYKVAAPIDAEFVERMNQLGGEGWEIVALRRVETTADDLPAMKRGYQPNPGVTEAEFEAAVMMKSGKMKYEAVLKRPKS